MIEIKNKKVSLMNKYTLTGSSEGEIQACRETVDLGTALQVCSVRVDVDHKLHHKHKQDMFKHSHSSVRP